jgi:myo-inositol-1(or 4)-monophosphatase
MWTRLTARGGELIAGVIYEPVRQEMFAAELGGGAYVNNRRIHVSKVERLADSLLITGFPSYKRHLSVNVHFFHQAAMATHGVRRSGSAAIDLAYVAAGRADGFWEFGLKPWDMAAGILLVEEAGGQCSDMVGAPRSVSGPHLVATNRSIHDETIGLFGEVFAGAYRVPLQQINPV